MQTKNVPAMTWLSMMVSDDVALAIQEKYGFPPLYNDFRKYLATLLANNGMRGVSRILLKLPVDYPVKYTDLFTHANAEDLVKWLWKTNHPDAIQILILV